MVNADFINNVLASFKQERPGANMGDFADFLAKEVADHQKLQAILRWRKNELDGHRKSYEEAVAKHDEAVFAIQKSCKHWARTHHVDPAGDSSESYSECQLCGKYL